MVKPTIYHIPSKLGEYVKTRKPFFFRSKKKKKMLQKNIYSFTVLKHSKITIINSSYQETSHLLSFSNLIKESNYMHLYCFDIFLPLKSKREVANIVLKDLLHSVRAWRQLRGYPQGGNTTYTNAKSSRKNKLLLFYRLEQFNSLFGQKKRKLIKKRKKRVNMR